VRAADGTLILLDCGTGAHALGEALAGAAGPDDPLHGHLLITHTHWDHIQGFPFFRPLFRPGSEWDVYAPGGLGQQLETTLAGQMQYPYFPVALGQLPATLRYHDLVEGRFRVGGVRVSAGYLNHPALTLGYRLEADGVTLVYATDHEPHGGVVTGVGPLAAGGPGSVHEEDGRHVAFLAGADLVIHDAQFTEAEYPARLGWGHTPAERAVDYALAAGARHLVLYHHDPLREDAALDRLVGVCRARVMLAGGDLEVTAAMEGQALDLTGPAAAGGPAAEGLPAAAAAGVLAAAPTILVVDDDPSVLSLLVATLAADGFRLLTATDGETALRLVRAERPDLILLDWGLPGQDGVAVARALRADPDPHLRTVPVVLVTGRDGPESTAAGFAAGVTDYLTKPFKTAHVRTRVRAWLLRTGRLHGPRLR
jgi:CheY-like chemotaxis protein/ribonuclease BN (tRNA processing enzyme)